MRRHAFNDMLGKGWDSAAQYSYCIQHHIAGDPQFWWVSECLRKWPAPPGGWGTVVRMPNGRFRKFPRKKEKTEEEHKAELAMRFKLIRLSSILQNKGAQRQAEQINKLAEGFFDE